MTLLGKVFPKLKRKGSRLSQLTSGSEDRTCEDNSPGASMLSQALEDEEATDYVFRIINTFRPESFGWYNVDSTMINMINTVEIWSSIKVVLK